LGEVAAFLKLFKAITEPKENTTNPKEKKRRRQPRDQVATFLKLFKPVIEPTENKRETKKKGTT